MPPKDEGRPLTKPEVALIRAWIDAGAVWPVSADATTSRGKHWSFQPVRRPRVPSVKRIAWVRNPVDAFVLSRLEAAGMSPARPAKPRALIRRASLDLLGLPPSPDDVDRFATDSSGPAWEKTIDRLLANPHYGERWGRHWLDLVRYADSNGYEVDGPKPLAWKYRDYVIRALNADKPYDRFILEQLAGDELADANTETVIATGFSRVGPWDAERGASVQKSEVIAERFNELDDMVSTTSQVFLALTIGCARCHDHMYDPIRQTDYYRLQAFLAATNEHEVSLVDDKTQAKWQAETDTIKAEIERIKKQLSGTTGEEEQRLRKQLAETEYKLPKPPASIFSVKNIEEKRTPIHLLDRGDEFKKQQKLGMRVLGVLLPNNTPELPADTGHPKTILAEWIIDPNHPLTARVIVNRIWLYHFGQGIVATPNDFGVNGSLPSHPELLDWLANQFVENGWKMKQLHRIILLSSAYRQSSQSPDAQTGLRKDPQNTLLWHFSRRRLTAEELRDSMLAISGRLNRKTEGPSVMVPVDQEMVNLLYKPSQWQVTKDPAEHNRRSIYLIAKRNLRLPFMDVFDQPDLQTSCFRRASSTHAPQVLELLNGTFSNQLANAFAKRIRNEAGDDSAAQITLAFRLATGRKPTNEQKELILEFLKTSPLEEFTLTLFNLNAFLYVE
ncbi:MAG: DUF1553 domain-containing protein [Planctomycetes bacterium]|nr:DUF1553 domain-containing protein [Planctomycetota bacterium]